MREGETLRRRGRLRELLLLATALIAVAVGVIAYATDSFRRADLGTADLRFEIRGEKPQPDDIVFVAVDDITFRDLGERWPFRRRLHARLLDRIERGDPKVVGFDIQFTEPSQDPLDDNLLIESVRKAGNVVLATTEVTEDGKTRIFGGEEGLEYSRATPSESRVVNDPGRIVRRMIARPPGIDSFPVAIAEKLAGREITPPEGDRSAWIDFIGGPRSIRTVSYSDVLRGRVPASEFRGKAVIVGASAPTLQDLHPTSTTGSGLPMPGPEIHANAVVTALDGFPLRESPGWLDILLIVVLGCVAPLTALRLGRWKAFAVAVGALLVAAVAAQISFEAGLIVAVVYPAVAWALGAVGAVGVSAITAAFERERTRDLFARFVPESVVDEALEAADGLRLGGVRRVGTVMFSDLRGFTSFAETLAPDDVIAILNRYLTEMSDAILDEGGTLVAYMGDGIMAVFGAPLEQPDHADRALRAACSMLDRMQGFNAWSRSEGLGDGFKMGIGLNSGPVMSGHVGSERRLEYTAIGDTTNTAARLEGMTKGTPHQLFVAQSTVDLLQDRDHGLDFAGEYEVRGRQAKIRLWAPPVEAPAGEQPRTAASTAS